MTNLLLTDSKPQKCIQLSSKNIRCNSYAQKGKQYCWRHSPEVSDDEKKRQSARGGKAGHENDAVKLPAVNIAGIDDIVMLLGDTINRLRDGSISHKFAASTAYVTMTLMMAMRESEAAKERKRIEELKANGQWPEPVIPPKEYIYKAKFYLDKDGKKYVDRGYYSGLYPEVEEPVDEFDNDEFDDDNENDYDDDNKNDNISDDCDNETENSETEKPEGIFKNPSIKIVFANKNLNHIDNDSS